MQVSELCAAVPAELTARAAEVGFDLTGFIADQRALVVKYSPPGAIDWAKWLPAIMAIIKIILDMFATPTPAPGPVA
jgi:hypothetical protein